MRRGRKKIEGVARRELVVKSRLNRNELSRLDARRGKLTRGAFMRHAAIDSIPPTIPPLNLSEHADLGRALGNLATVATAMRGGVFVEIEECRQAVRQVRDLLIGGPQFSHCDEEPT